MRKDEWRRLRACPCCQAGVWRREASRPEEAPEHAVCLLTDADFEDDYCDACFEARCASGEIPERERAFWKRLPQTTRNCESA